MESLRTEGLRATAGRVARALADRIRPHWHHLFVLDLSTYEPPPGDDTLALRVVRKLDDLSASDWADLDRSLGANARDLIATRLRAGADLHFLVVGDRVAGTRFFVRGATHPFQHVPLSERDVMVLDGRIDPDLRGRGYNVPFYAKSLAELKRRGAQHVWVDCAEHNERSRRSYARLGFRFVLRYRTRWGRYRFDSDIVH
jgi:GNAT superfamily N-acetyltransferase